MTFKQNVGLNQITQDLNDSLYKCKMQNLQKTSQVPNNQKQLKQNLSKQNQTDQQKNRQKLNSPCEISQVANKKDNVINPPGRQQNCQISNQIEPKQTKIMQEDPIQSFQRQRQKQNGDGQQQNGDGKQQNGDEQQQNGDGQQQNGDGQKKSNKKKVQFCDGSIIFTIDPEYQIEKLIGSGIYGIVASGKNTLTNQTLAIKKISKLFNNFGDTKRVLRQIKVLQFLNHKNIISLQSIMSIDDAETFNQIYLCMEYMEFDLRRLIQSQTKITEPMIKLIMYQLLAAINFMHSADILHRDLKPQNILMNKKCELKLADMNLARKETFVGNITDYVASRPYRAPQILIGSTVYTKSVDIWSIGCIFAELLGKTIIFQGKDFIDQLKRFVAVLGKPKVQYFPHIDKTSMQSLGKLIAQIPDIQKVKWKYLMPNISDKAADLLDHMLTYDTQARYTADQCLNHPYLEQYRKAPRIKCHETFDFSFDRIQLCEKALRKAISQSVSKFQEKRLKLSQNQKNATEQQKIRKKIKENE